jgi:hypothetical protein
MTAKRKYVLHKENCQTCIRKVHKSKGTTIVLSGQHGFQWSITEDNGTKCKMTTYPNRKSALKVYNHIIKMV